MLRIYYTLCFLFPALFIQAQDSIIISGQLIGNDKYAVVDLMKFEVGQVIIAKTTIEEDKFRLALPKDIAKGVYRLQYSQTEPARHVDVIVAGEARIDFVLNLNNPAALPEFTASAQNKAWYAYLSTASALLQKITTLSSFISQYPGKQDEVMKQTALAFATEKKALANAFDSFTKQYKNTYAGKMVQNRPYWFPNPNDEPRLQAFYYKEQYWKNIHTTDTTLLNTPLYNEHILRYLQYYMNAQMDIEEQTAGFKKSVDTIMQRFSGNERIQKFALDYLTLGFKEIGQEEVLQYLDETYRTAAQCESDQEKEEFAKRMVAYEAMKPGQLAPEIEFANLDGSTLGLKDIEADTLIVAFWASWCPHCMEAMPRLNAEMGKHSNKKVLAVSLDEDPTAYRQAAGKLNNLLHLCDYGKWNSKPVADYHVMATPTFFVLDKERKIVGKYDSVEQLLQRVLE